MNETRQRPTDGRDPAPRVAVTGIGIVCAAGIGVEQYWSNVLAGTSGLDVRRSQRLEEIGDRFVGEVDDDLLADALRNTVGAGRVDDFDRPAAMTIVAAHEALRMAGANLEDYPPSRLGLIVGKCQPEYKGISQADESAYAHTPCERLAEELGLRGPIMTIATACAAGTNAVGAARDKLWCDEADLMLAGGVDTLLPGTVAGFAAMQALSDGPCAPYSQSDGLTIGEGAAFLVLEPLEAAERRGATVHALVLGYGLSADAYHLTAPDPMGRGPMLAVNRALDDAALGVDAVDYVNGHGTGTPANDRMERRLMRGLFGNRGGVPISSTKSITGHTLGAAGAVEAVTSVLALEHGMVPPTLNCPEPTSGQDEDALDFVGNRARPAELDVVLSNSYAFGGNNAALVLGAAGRANGRPQREAGRRAVVTGIGVVGSLGIGVDDWRKALERAEPGFRRIRSFDPERFGCDRAAEIDERFESMSFAKPRDWRHMDAITRQSLAATRLAMEDAAFDPTGATRTDTGVFLGTAYGPAYTSYSLIGRGGSSSNPQGFAQSSLNTPAGLVCQVLGMRGPTTTLASSTVSGTLALAAAVTAIELGHADTVIVIAADEFSELSHRAADKQGVLAGDGIVRPYDIDRSGTVLGEMVVAVIVESADSALHRQARPYCRIAGRSHRVIEPSASTDEAASAYADAIRAALDGAGRAGDEIRYCVGAAAGQPVDAVELEAIDAAMAGTAVTAPKSLTGECFAPSGLMNVVVAALGISDHLAVPTPNLTNPVGSSVTHVSADGAPIAPFDVAVALDSWRGISFTSTVVERFDEEVGS